MRDGGRARPRHMAVDMQHGPVRPDTTITLDVLSRKETGLVTFACNLALIPGYQEASRRALNPGAQQWVKIIHLCQWQPPATTVTMTAGVGTHKRVSTRHGNSRHRGLLRMNPR
jgi:hypothetical protein